MTSQLDCNTNVLAQNVNCSIGIVSKKKQPIIMWKQKPKFRASLSDSFSVASKSNVLTQSSMKFLLSWNYSNHPKSVTNYLINVLLHTTHYVFHLFTISHLSVVSCDFLRLTRLTALQTIHRSVRWVLCVRFASEQFKQIQFIVVMNAHNKSSVCSQWTHTNIASARTQSLLHSNSSTKVWAVCRSLLVRCCETFSLFK